MNIFKELNALYEKQHLYKYTFFCYYRQILYVAEVVGRRHENCELCPFYEQPGGYAEQRKFMYFVGAVTTPTNGGIIDI